MLEVIDLFREKGIVDELGFGTIRDSFSDLFFPGTSTLHTRARYLLFIPWIYKRIQHSRVPYPQVDQRARADQALIARALRQGGEQEAQGVIGIQAGENLQRPPSVVYWSALRRFRIWRFPGSIAQFYASSARHGATASAIRSDDGELVEQATLRSWDPGLPPEPKGIFEATSFKLTFEEASYLRERIISEIPGTLFALCIESDKNLGRIDAPWLLPDVALYPTQLRHEIDQAEKFALLSYGAAIAYNVMLAEKSREVELPVGSSLVERYRNDYSNWATSVEQRLGWIRSWNIGDLWKTVVGKGHNISSATRQFVELWVGTASRNPATAVDDTVMRRAVVDRELRLKGGLARLTHRKQLERYAGDAGLYQQVYRWPNARRIVGDIREGLRRPSGEDS